MFKLFGNLARKNTKIPPKSIKELFLSTFPLSVNDEWLRTSKGYEVIFHQNEVEKIAKYTKSGQLIETRTNLTFAQVPPEIKLKADVLGEIMNAILIDNLNTIFYELIYRDAELNRYVILFDQQGEKLQHKLL